MCPGSNVTGWFFFCLMATKETPKKFCRNAATNLSSCRLCKAVFDSKHCKNLYKSYNRAILKNAEEIYGNVLPQDDNLPHLICRPCERRVGNTIQFKRMIVETQRSLEQGCRTKRCVEISPSVVEPPGKMRSSGDSSSLSRRRRSLDFNETDTQVPVLRTANTTTSVPLEVRSVLNSCATRS